MAQAAMTDVRTLLGPMAVGSVLSGVAFGCAVVQTYSYYQRFPRDSRYIKALVNFEMALQTTHLFLQLAALWHMVVTIYGNPSALILFPNTMNITLIICAPLALAPQAFFIYRLWRLSQNPALVGFCSLLAACRFAFHLIVGITAIHMRNIALVIDQWKWSITTMFVTSVACDAIVAIAVTHILRTQRTEFRRTSWIIDKLIFYSVATGLITIGGELAQALCFWAMPHNYVWLGFYAVESGLYTNSLLAALNSRAVFDRTWTIQPSTDRSSHPSYPRSATGDKAPYFSVVNIPSEDERSGQGESPYKGQF